MVARTVKFMGQAYSTSSTVTIEVEYNNTIVYSDTLLAVTRDPLPVDRPEQDFDAPTWEKELFSFSTDTDITGQIPVRITVANGTVFFGHLWMNYTGNYIVEKDPNDPSKFIKIPIAPVDYFNDPNTNTVESDGVSNTMKNGVSWLWRTNVDSQLGDWAYPTYDSETLTFDFFVDPAKVVLDPYVPPV